MSFVFTEEDFILKTKELINKKTGIYSRISAELKYKADNALYEAPVAVTFAKSPAASGNIHDYFSEGPYWWPDPQNPGGPYIRRDGETNLDRFTAHRSMLEKMSANVLILAQAGYFLDKPEYTQQAVNQLRIWFLDKETCMNPHLEYGQAIRGVCQGRGIGIIETKDLLAVVHAADFISMSGEYNLDIEELKEWFRKYLKWMNESDKGIEERDWYNNHSVWWTAQALAYAVFTGNKQIAAQCCERYKNVIIPGQLNKDSAFDDELKRTRSYTYYLFILDAASIICETARNIGIDLWSYETDDGKSLKKAFEFIAPAYENIFMWKYPQINMRQCFEDRLSFQLASVRLSKPDYEKMNDMRRHGRYLICHTCELGSLALLPGFEGCKA